MTLTRKDQEHFPQNAKSPTQLHPPRPEGRQARSQVAYYQQALSLQRAIGNRAYQNLIRNTLVLDNPNPVQLRNGPEQIARETHADSKKYLVEQVDPFKDAGDIDQDTGNCMLGSKLISLKYLKYLDSNISLFQVLQKFYQGQNGQTRIPKSIEGKQRFFVFGKMSYRRLGPDDLLDLRKTKKAAEHALQSREEDWWAFGSTIYDWDSKTEKRYHCREVYRGKMSGGNILEVLDGFMVFSSTIYGDTSFVFMPRFQDGQANTNLLRNIGDDQQLHLFLKFLKKYFPSETHYKNPAGFHWKWTSKPVAGNQYIVARPGHYFVIIVQEVNGDKVKALKLDPMDSETKETEFEKPILKNLYQLIGE